MAVFPRAMRSNILRDSSVVLSSVDEQPSAPSSWLKDQARGKKTRTLVGYTVVPGRNSAIPFDGSDGKRLAYIASGNYATPAAYAAAAQTAIQNCGYHPKALASFTAEWRADRSTLDANGLVSAAADMSGLGSRDMSQGTAGQRPLWVANALNTGRPAWYFDGTNRSLVSAANLSTLLGANGVGTIVVVFALDSDASANDALVWASANAGADVVDLMWVGGAGKDFRARGTDAVGVKSATKTATNGVGAIGVAIWQYNGTNLFAGAFNSASANFSAGTAMAAVKASVLGVPLNIGSNGTDHLKGYIFGVQVYNTAIPGTDRLAKTAVQRYAGLIEGSSAPVWGDVWGTSYDPTTSKFTWSHISGAGTATLPAAAQPAWLNGEDFNERAYPDLGITTDRTAITTALGDTVSYQSRHYYKADLGAANAARQWVASLLVDHNLSGTGTATLKNSAIDLWTAISGVGSQALNINSAFGSILFSYFAAVANRWWSLELNDVQNPVGYNELAVWSLTPIDAQPSVGYSDEMEPNYKDLSVQSYGSFGALREDERPQCDTWRLVWKNIVTADKDLLVALRRITPKGRAFFFAFDATGDPTNVEYVEFASEIKVTHNQRNSWNAEVMIQRVLP